MNSAGKTIKINIKRKMNKNKNIKRKINKKTNIDIARAN